MACQMCSSLDNSRPPSYHSHINTTQDDDGAQGSPGNLAINEMLPDKDEQLAEEALQGTEPASAHHIDHFDDSIIGKFPIV